MRMTSAPKKKKTNLPKKIGKIKFKVLKLKEFLLHERCIEYFLDNGIHSFILFILFVTFVVNIILPVWIAFHLHWIYLNCCVLCSQWCGCDCFFFMTGKIWHQFKLIEISLWHYFVHLFDMLLFDLNWTTLTEMENKEINCNVSFTHQHHWISKRVCERCATNP